MLITIRESMLMRKCLNNYMLDNSLEYDKSPLINDLIHKLKDFEYDEVIGHIVNDSKYIEKLHKKYNIDNMNELKKIIKDEKRNELKKELKKYSIQTKCNKKILELDELERVESINNNKKGSK